MARPRLLDLFCGAGGSAVGYHRAGFDVVGVDVAAQPNYPFTFWQADALALAPGYITADFDAVHASPPCQAYTSMQSMQNAREHPELIGPTRELLEATGLPYVIENVEAALPHMREPFRLCGSSFALGTIPNEFGDGPIHQLRRHRYFETNWPIGVIPACAHNGKTVGIYGDHLRLGRRSRDGEFSGEAALAFGSEAMGIDWMTWDELREAIPPAYTELIGHQLLSHINHARGAVPVVAAGASEAGSSGPLVETFRVRPERNA